jgi:hypothetical protein
MNDMDAKKKLAHHQGSVLCDNVTNHLTDSELEDLDLLLHHPKVWVVSKLVDSELSNLLRQEAT